MTKKKTYTALQEEVWDNGICSGCGACVAVCPADALFFPDDPGIMRPVSSGYCKQETDQYLVGHAMRYAQEQNQTSQIPLDLTKQLLGHGQFLKFLTNRVVVL